jgi:hypothetical protein
MKTAPRWVASAALPYLLAGIGWVLVGALVLGVPQGLGLIFIGLACLAIGPVAGRRFRRSHRFSQPRSDSSR